MKKLLLLSSLLCASAAFADGGNLPPALGTLGRFHLVLLHFPIALLFGVAATEAFLRRRLPEEKRVDAIGALLVFAAAGAVVATATGLLLAADEEFRGHTATMLSQHRVGGIVTAVLAVATAVAFRKASLKKAYLPLLAASLVGVTLTGHRGGDLVHGEGYLLSSLAEKKVDKEDGDLVVASDGDETGNETGNEERQRYPEGSIPSNPTYAKDIKPLLDRSCVKCHGPEKRKGGLRLDKKRFALKGGETGPAVVAGNVAESLLIKYITLPADDEDIMPSRGKLLANSEIETLKKWVEQGAQWPDDG